ncbi:MAG: hypothetical protein KME31_21945 [Tolypothrix carrinoi HA7290-LM1]|nr:hypothetical protein [Tolypothrix carrinoi HA7290-LM1]
MGNGNKKKRSRISLAYLDYAPCPMPHAPCPMPHAPCPMPHAPLSTNSSKAL